MRSRDPRAISIEYAIGEDLTKASLDKLKIFDSLFLDKGTSEDDELRDPFEEDPVYSGLSCEFYLFRDLYKSGFSQADPKDPLSQTVLFENFIANTQFEQLMDAVSILDQQKQVIRLLRSYPVYRENIGAVPSFDTSFAQTALEQAKAF